MLGCCVEIRKPSHELLSWRALSCRGKKVTHFIARWFTYILLIFIYSACQNLENVEKFGIPFYAGEAVSNKHNFFAHHDILRWAYNISGNLLSWILLFLFIILWETMIDRISRQKENVQTLSNLIIRNTYSEYIEFDYVDNVLSWLALEDFVKRKGMLLFSALETPLFSLFMLSLLSWSSSIYCIFKGHGLSLNNDHSLFSNSALATWFYLALLSFFQVARMLWYGQQFHRESLKQDKGMPPCWCMHFVQIIVNVQHCHITSHQVAMR